jgi:hypothetical protein
MPASTRWCGRPSSATVHITFCTLMELVRPKIFSMLLVPIDPSLYTGPRGR